MREQIFLNDKNEIVPPNESTHFIAQEYDDNGVLVNETIGVTENDGERPNFLDEELEVTPEIREILNNCKDKNGNYMFRRK